MPAHDDISTEALFDDIWRSMHGRDRTTGASLYAALDDLPDVPRFDTPEGVAVMVRVARADRARSGDGLPHGHARFQLRLVVDLRGADGGVHPERPVLHLVAQGSVSDDGMVSGLAVMRGTESRSGTGDWRTNRVIAVFTPEEIQLRVTARVFEVIESGTWEPAVLAVAHALDVEAQVHAPRELAQVDSGSDLHRGQAPSSRVLQAREDDREILEDRIQLSQQASMSMMPRSPGIRDGATLH